MWRFRNVQKAYKQVVSTQYNHITLDIISPIYCAFLPVSKLFAIVQNACNVLTYFIYVQYVDITITLTMEELLRRHMACTPQVNIVIGLCMLSA